MKQILSIIIFSLFAFTASSQVITLKSVYGNSSDTVVNGATEYLTSTAISSYTKIKVLTVVLNTAEISGTTGGTAELQGSIDGTNYYDIGDTTYTLGDAATNIAAWKVADFGDIYVRIKVTGTGTMSDKIFGKMFIRTY